MSTRTWESYKTLDVNQLSEKGCLRPGCSSTCRWIVNNEDASINLRAEAERLCLSYTLRVGDGGCEEMAETISIVHLRCRFGGSRAYFICPGRDGTECGRRITKLHLSRRYFLCRHMPVRLSERGALNRRYAAMSCSRFCLVSI